MWTWTKVLTFRFWVGRKNIAIIRLLKLILIMEQVRHYFWPARWYFFETTPFLELVDWKSIANGEETANDNQSKKRKKKKRKNGSKENGSNDGSEIGSNGTNENGIETGPEPMEIDGEIKTKKTRSQRRSEQKKKLEEKKKEVSSSAKKLFWITSGQHSITGSYNCNLFFLTVLIATSLSKGVPFQGQTWHFRLC